MLLLLPSMPSVRDEFVVHGWQQQQPIPRRWTLPFPSRYNGGGGWAFVPFDEAATATTRRRRRTGERRRRRAGVLRRSNAVASEDYEDGASTIDPSLLRSVTFCGVTKEPALLCDLLLEVGACSASITDYDKGTDAEVPILAEPMNHPEYDPFADLVLQKLPVWNRCNVTAHFPASVDLNGVLELVEDTIFENDDDDENGDDGTAYAAAATGTGSPYLQAIETSVIRDTNADWVVRVQQGWPPFVVGGGDGDDRSRLVVIQFPWHTREDIDAALGRYYEGKETGMSSSSSSSSSSFLPPPLQLQLQGGIAFGTGEHPTTQLCLEWLLRNVGDELRRPEESGNDRTQREDAVVEVLDYGCGSGVLGLAACMLDPDRVSSVGLDIDYDACRIANENARINGDLRMRSYLPPLRHRLQRHGGGGGGDDDESDSLLMKAHARARSIVGDDDESDDDSVFMPDELQDKKFPVVVANILAKPLIALAPSLVSRLGAGGRLGMSGILSHQAGDVSKAYEAAGLTGVRVEGDRDGWVLVTGRRE